MAIRTRNIIGQCRVYVVVYTVQLEQSNIGWSLKLIARLCLKYNYSKIIMSLRLGVIETQNMVNIRYTYYTLQLQWSDFNVVEFCGMLELIVRVMSVVA